MTQKYFVRKENIGYLCFMKEDGCYREIEPIEGSDSVSILDKASSGQSLSAPLQVVLYPGLRCNINCPFCYLSTHRSDIMAEETINNVLKYMQANYVGRLQILGGEPFHPHLYPATREIIQRSEMYPAIQELTLTTNGYYLHEVDLDLMQRREVIMSVSLHGIGDLYNQMVGAQTRNIFARVWRNLELLSARQQEVQIVTVVTSKNIKFLAEIKRHIDALPNVLSWTWLYPNLRETGSDLAPGLQKFFATFKALCIETSYRVNINMPFQFRLRQSAQPHTDFERAICRCSTIDGKKIEIMPDGTVYHCGMFFGQEEYALGNINTEFNINRKYPECRIVPESCAPQTCEYYENCYGCLGWALKNGKSVDDRCAREHCLTC